MEYLEGKSLSQFGEGGARLSVDRICHIGSQIAHGVAAAHAGGIIHRDLKPDNIFVIQRGTDPDFVKILDFGIAKVTGGANTKLTRAGAVFGTPHYMSPEQAAGAPVDHRTDIYALGVILYEMVSGQLPFNADNFMGILTQHMYKAPVPIRALVPGPDCPPSLEAVILKCLSKKPDGRYNSMDELAADLDRVRTGGVALAVGEMMARSGGFNVPADYFKQPAAMVPATPHTPVTRWPRYVAIAGAAASVGLVTTIFVISAITRGMPAHKTSTPPAATTSTAAVANLGTPLTTSASPAPVVAPAAPSAKKTVAVAIAASPETATVYRDGVLLHQVPWTIELEEGKPALVEVRADGYDSQTVLLDGSEPSNMVKLKPRRSRAWTRPVGTSAPRPSPQRGGDVVDPWSH